MEISNQFLDVKSLKPNSFEGISNKNTKTDKALKDVCNNFESFFMNQILETSLKSSKIAGEGTGSDIIKGMYTDALSQESSGSLGISDMLYKFLSEKKIMIDITVLELQSITDELKKSLLLDIEDVKKANHESLVSRNSTKLTLMDDLSELKQKLNSELSEEYKDGKDISIYKSSIDELEKDLRELYELNGKLASIVLPVKEMYKEIIDEITELNGGSLIEVMA